ncbi:uncharacterized protein LOC133298127 [Gastrolobium bilobum]|uniref:uncharacterized protein LOC133298127 n=1 Tax=Gastrolobium bilobum TaxID=150636 RepID=UPI002AAFC9FD|nr:uncharacterized protein LOC133298127 [Gastrolobium bilobum]
MVVKKHSFRFRIPWPSRAPAKESLRRHPKDRSKFPTQSDTNVPIQQPSSSSVITPLESPPSPTKTHVDPNAETQNHSPPHLTEPTTSSVIIESPGTIHSEPPFRSTSPNLVNSPLPSLQPSTHADSPSHVYIESSSPETQPQSPSHLSSESTQPASEQEKEKMVVSEPIPQEAELKVNSPLRAIPKSPEISSLLERMSTQPEGSEQQASSVPSSSSVFKTEPAFQPHPSSPSASERTSEVLTPKPEESTLPVSSASQDEEEKMAVAVAEPVSQEAEPKMKSPLKTIPKSPETSFLPERMSTQPAGSQQASSMPSSSPVSKSEPPPQPHPSSPLVSKPNFEENKLPALSTSQEEKKKLAEPMPHEVEPKMKSPLKIIPKSPETSERMSTQPTVSHQASSLLSSPLVSKTEPPSQPRPSSPLVSKPNFEESKLPALSTSQEEKEKLAELEPQEVESKMKSPLKIIPKSPETSERMSTQPAVFHQASSLPSSPLVSKTEPPSQPYPSSPLVSKPNFEEIKLLALSTSLEEKKKLAEPMPQEVEPKMKSPLKIVPKSPETSERMSTQPAVSHQASSLPSSPLVSKIEPPSQPHPSSPLVLKPNTEECTSPASSIFQEEKEKMVVAVAKPLAQEAEPKMKSPLKIIPESTETSSQPENLSTQLTTTLGDVERSTTPKVPLEKTKSKFRETQGKEKMVHEAIKAGKAKDTTTGQQTRRTIASSSGTKAKDPCTRAFSANKKQHGTRETVERKVMFVSSSPSRKDIKVVSATDPGTRNVSTISPEKAQLAKGIKDDISKFVHKLASVHPAQPMDEKPFSVITLTGDNRGATMHVGSESTKKEGSIHIQRAYKTDPEESTEVTTDAEENTEEDSHNSTEQGEVGKAYVNSNIQSINNSVMFHGSITERDPGVEVTLPQNPIKLDDEPALETHRTEFNISRAQKSSYQPMVQRRCLRGLFLEPSDSDPENPDKPRRHGCKFSCGQNIEDIEIL